MYRSIVVPFALALAFFPLAQASATAFVDVGAGFHDQSGSLHDFEGANNSSAPNPPEKAEHGAAVANGFGVDAFVAPGPMPSCDALPIGFSCATEGPGAHASGEVRGELGLLRAVASATTHVAVLDPEHGTVSGVTNAVALATVRLGDAFLTTSAGDVTFHLHLDVDVTESGLPDVINDDILELKFDLTGLGTFSFPEFDFMTPYHESSHNVIDETFVLSNLPANTLIIMSLEMRADAECGVNPFVAGGADCSVFIDAGNTAYLGVEGNVISGSGYAYPGFRAAATVPAPASLGLFLFGLVGLGALRYRAS